jgi:hypothetical protein
MLRAMLLDRKCWQSAVMLDPETGRLFPLCIFSVFTAKASILQRSSYELPRVSKRLIFS